MKITGIRYVTVKGTFEYKGNLGEERLVPLETRLESQGAPWTPSRFPEWERK